MRKLIFAALIMAAPLVVACNTVEGAGKDVAKVGDHVQKRAEQVKNGVAIRMALLVRALGITAASKGKRK